MSRRKKWNRMPITTEAPVVEPEPEPELEGIPDAPPGEAEIDPSDYLTAVIPQGQPSERGMRCPNLTCQSAQSRVSSTVRKPGGVLRYRVCLRCGQHFRGFESHIRT